MSNSNPKESVRHIGIDPKPKGNLKSIGGADHDDWNDWLAASTARALPVDQRDENAATKAMTAAFSGMIDLKPADPVEGILISQLMAANQASLSMYRRAWAQPPEYLEAQLRYLTMADKAARTVSMLTERLDHHRGRGQQQIVVKHVTVNADQAVITDQILAGDRSAAGGPSPALVTAKAEVPMQKLDEAIRADPVPAGGGTKAK
ncbi:MAG TPA: hypothetical protein VHT68_02645 [Pseudolabrys sp.]|jgi:hypothetical protein|nr:hypothetical protein [Pseudolabrys sp.]